jgi:N-formylglutamate deformylase
VSFTLVRGTAPLLVSLPHVGTRIPEDLRPAYVERALEAEDTDWHLERLYAFARELGASLLVPQVSRYVIDLNRPPDDAPMYPGAANTELCPTRFFTGEPLYRQGQAPDAAERARRKAAYWQPYHDALAAELARLRGLHGNVLLWDGHSIRSAIPWLFEGVLPDLNIGTAGGGSAHASITEAVVAAAGRHPHLSLAVNGRFKGGYITRRYGRPSEGVDAVQLELAQSTYMDESAGRYDRPRAETLQKLLSALLAAARG